MRFMNFLHAFINISREKSPVGLNLAASEVTASLLFFHFLDQESDYLKYVLEVKHNIEELHLAEQVLQAVLVIFYQYEFGYCYSWRGEPVE
jgi:hypothetical protein